mgnify:CR=1 FL=1
MILQSGTIRALRCAQRVRRPRTALTAPFAGTGRTRSLRRSCGAGLPLAQTSTFRTCADGVSARGSSLVRASRRGFLSAKRVSRSSSLTIQRHPSLETTGYCHAALRSKRHPGPPRPLGALQRTSARPRVQLPGFQGKLTRLSRRLKSDCFKPAVSRPTGPVRRPSRV